MSTVADSLEMDEIYENKYDRDIEESDDHINDLDPSISLIQSPPSSGIITITNKRIFI